MTAPSLADLGYLPGEFDGVHRGQVRLAYRLADANRGRLMHVHGVGWHRWDGARWTEDQHGQAVQALLDVYRAALVESIGGPGGRELLDDVRRCESSAGMRGVLDVASALPPFAVTVRDLDADPYLLNCANGTLDLHTLTLRPHDPADRITKVCGAAFDPNATGTTWRTFLGRSLPDPEVVGYLQRYVGVALCGKVLEHSLAILTGTGRNGKGVFYGAVNRALGDYALVAEPDLLMHRDGAHPTGEMDLRGVRWAVVSESDKGRRLAEATVKRLTGGDKIRARRMRQDFVEFEASHTAALVTNHLPRVSGDDPALWARLRVVPWDVTIPEEERDPHLGERLEAEADAILTWAIRGWSAYLAGGMAEPKAVTERTSAYQLSSDTIARFIEERCYVNRNESVRVDALWAAFESWSRDDGADPISKRAFSDAMDQRGFRATRTKVARMRQGLALVDDEEGQKW